FVEGFEAADPAIASAIAIAQEWETGIDDTTARPSAGYAPLVEYLMHRCEEEGAHIWTSTTVQGITWKRGSVEVECAGAGGASQLVRARAAVVTLPVGVLRYDGAVRFDPALPESKCGALARIEMGHAVKIALGFATPFWERVHSNRYRQAGFFRCESGSFAAFWTQYPIRGDIVMAWAGGPKATALHGKTADELGELALAEFGSLLGETEVVLAEFEGSVMHDWSSDPFSRGAYSYVAVGGDGAREALAEPLEDTLFFAGEATSTDGQGGTVNGALRTGARAAMEVLKALAGRS
ncbi:MAG: FAD-dependent oxidoreductase, partial [Candidatus Eremiobacteraeota bacterium]|nr:FAD-dependent oxidoreductase [Candidatus Eremiobacteraeota bacterium]